MLAKRTELLGRSTQNQPQTLLLDRYDIRLQELREHFATLRSPRQSQRLARTSWLARWIQREGMLPQDILWQLQHRDFRSAHHYFAQLFANQAVRYATLEHAEQLMRTTMPMPELDAQAALALIQQYYDHTNPEWAAWLRQFIARQRLNLRDAATDHAWCLDTPFGAYVRVDYQPDFPNLMTLAHELGHAYHQDRHRTQSSRPLRIIEKETAALTAEHGLLRWLMQQPHPYPTAALAYQQYLEIEMVDRQRMLSQFEFDLYALPSMDLGSIRALWRHHLTQFYGAQILLDEEDEDAWRTLPQLLTAPFYRLSYPIAYARVMGSLGGHCCV